MGFLDRFKGKATDLAAEHSGQIDAGIDKAADLASKATKGKFDEKIEAAADKAKDGVDKIGENNV